MNFKSTRINYNKVNQEEKIGCEVLPKKFKSNTTRIFEIDFCLSLDYSIDIHKIEKK